MKLSFHGAAQTVTGSKHLLTLDSGKKILLDCGMFQGMGQLTDKLNNDVGFDPAEVKHLILSHAHIDHSGLIPKLVKEGFNGAIHCTSATRDLAGILLEDSATIQRDDTKFINRKRKKKGLPLFEPMFDLSHVAQAMELFNVQSYGQWFTIDEGVEVLFTDAGHIIGSAAVSLRIKEGDKATAITFSGDVGRYNDAILKAPEVFPQADYIICESTYGNKLHDDVHGTTDTLHGWIEKTCIHKKGKLIIPAFSVGRTQELLIALNQLENEKRLPAVTYYVDSPLSLEATEVVRSHPENFNKQLRDVLMHDEDVFAFKGLKYIKSVDESKAINDTDQPCVIISSSGMADAGRVKHHIRNNISEAKNTILMVGYASPYSLGGKLANGVKRVNIYGEEYNVEAEVGKMRSMSAHADYDDLVMFLDCQDRQKVKKLFLVHGEYHVQLDFAQRLTRKGWQVEVPGMNSVFELA
ncbi:MBL fold metallo-hydrolase RNA specificity domain-containing protein [Aridibaculum aurantiacum]|uniref:MBL fold metallo-hydrolase RNA specificity domain-containing protein n=1 Tax=Aridibaculum aurantiacum TaxID=2810307 RepID=UPI001A974DE0|nr:MBL fold metallo-hydrolase [Aridibaculum aurantiacum]